MPLGTLLSMLTLVYIIEIFYVWGFKEDTGVNCLWGKLPIRRVINATD